MIVRDAGGDIASAVSTSGWGFKWPDRVGDSPIVGAGNYADNRSGAAAYFAYVNDHGGVNGRKIQYQYLDDGYDPTQTVQLTRQLVQQDNVLAIFNTIGTDNALAVRPFLNQLNVPMLFAGTGVAALVLLGVVGIGNARRRRAAGGLRQG